MFLKQLFKIKKKIKLQTFVQIFGITHEYTLLFE